MSVFIEYIITNSNKVKALLSIHVV